VLQLACCGIFIDFYTHKVNLVRPELVEVFLNPSTSSGRTGRIYFRL
jgi:hypothetical protein